MTPHLLITDDDRAFRETVQHGFADRGVRTTLAANGREAMQIVLRDDVHCLILDHHMPILTGLELLQQMRSRQIALPCILVSAGLDEALVAEARANSAFQVLAKPVSLREVKATVWNALAVHYQWSPPR